jgi:hypothetical protein
LEWEKVFAGGIKRMQDLYREIIRRIEEQGVELLGLHRKHVLSVVAANPKQYAHQVQRAEDAGDLCIFHTSDWTSELGKGINEAFKKLYGLTVEKALAEVTHPTTLDAILLSRDVCAMEYEQIARTIAAKYRPDLEVVKPVPLPPALSVVFDYLKAQPGVRFSAGDVARAFEISYNAAYYRLNRLVMAKLIEREVELVDRRPRVFYLYPGKTAFNGGGGLSVAALMTLNAKAAEDLLRAVFKKLGAGVWPREKRVGSSKFDVWGEFRGVPFVGSLKLYDEVVTKDRATKDVRNAARRLRKLFAFYTHPTEEAARLIVESGGVVVKVPYVQAIENELLKHYFKLKGTKTVSPSQFMRVAFCKLKKELEK